MSKCIDIYVVHEDESKNDKRYEVRARNRVLSRLTKLSRNKSGKPKRVFDEQAIRLSEISEEWDFVVEYEMPEYDDYDLEDKAETIEEELPSLECIVRAETEVSDP